MPARKAIYRLQLYSSGRFETIESIGNLRTLTTHAILLGNPTKHAAVLAESVISYDAHQYRLLLTVQRG